MDYFEIQHIKMNFLPAIGGKDYQFKNAIFLKYMYTGVDPCSIWKEKGARVHRKKCEVMQIDNKRTVFLGGNFWNRINLHV